MATRFKFDPWSSEAAIKLILANRGGSCTFHDMFKVLYFAEKKHLSEWASQITGDVYDAMEYGPVPSRVYAALKVIRAGGQLSTADVRFAGDLSVQRKHHISLKSGAKPADLDNISEAAVESILWAIEHTKNMSFAERTDASHDQAYDAADLNAPMSLVDIATSGGADPSIVELLEERLENEDAFFAA